jgi:hypothetical protein
MSSFPPVALAVVIAREHPFYRATGAEQVGCPIGLVKKLLLWVSLGDGEASSSAAPSQALIVLVHTDGPPEQLDHILQHMPIAGSQCCLILQCLSAAGFVRSDCLLQLSQALSVSEVARPKIGA